MKKTSAHEREPRRHPESDPKTDRGARIDDAWAAAPRRRRSALGSLGPGAARNTCAPPAAQSEAFFPLLTSKLEEIT